MSTLIVNLFGGPSIGKSTMAAGLFCLLKMHEIECELVTEFAKDLVWEERSKTLENQQYIFGKQYHKIWRLLNKVEVIITDSPLMLSVIYASNSCVKSFTENVVDTTNTLDNLNIILYRKNKYKKIGRYQTEQEAKIIDDKIKQSLILYDMRFEELRGDIGGINALTDMIIKKLNRYTTKFCISHQE
jgi:tRNA uridine 5-carbamoylmethylation protein Kti12